MSGIHDAIAQSDSSALVPAAHTLKGSGGYFLPESVLKKLDDLEQMGYQGNLSTAGERFVELDLEMERLKPEVLMLATKGLRGQED